MTSMSELPQPSKPETVAVVAHGRIDVGPAVERVRRVAAEAGVTVIDEPTDADLTVAVGGDGTILRTLARLLGTDVPVIGVNFGRVGFLASIAPEALERDLARVFAGEYRVLELPTLEVKLDGEQYVAVNDVVTTSATLGRMVELTYSVGGEDLGTIPCDGMICSTPSGSTAYNLSNGGPVLVRGVDAMAITFIAPHSLHARPLVVPRGSPLTVRNATADVSVCVLVDGHQVAEMESGDEIVIALGGQRSLLATHAGDDVLRPLPRDVRVVPVLGTSWWLEEAATAFDDDVSEPLAGDVEADVCIVGGGFTGLWTALAVKERDPSAHVVLLEAERCGAGPSGRNGGFLHGYWAGIGRARSVLGEQGALAIARAGEGIIPAVRALGADVWLHESGMLSVSTTPAQDRALDDSVDAAAAVGAPEQAVPLDPDELAQRIQSPVFRRGVFFPECATVQPARLVRVLRRKAIDAGVELHERTPVRRIEDLRGAKAIVVATNAAASGWRPVRRHVTNFGSYVVLTEPVPDLLAEIGWTGGEAVVDGRMFLHYFRTTDDGRVVMGSGSGPIGFGGRVDARFTHDAATAARAEAGLRRLLPGLARARGRARVGRPYRCLRRSPTVLRDGGGNAHPLRARLLRQRRRPELDRRAGPRLARARPRRRVVVAPARAPAAVAAAGAVEADRRRARARGHPRVRGGGGGRPPPIARRARGRRGTAEARDADRDAMSAAIELEPSRSTTVRTPPSTA